MKKRAKVDIQYACKYPDLPNKSDLIQWVNTALSVPSLEKNLHPLKRIELTIRIVDELEGRQLNETWRQRQGATNVLSFPIDCPEEVDFHLLGDLVICAPVVHREANEQKKTLYAHWAHLVIHGTLHLLGYDHLEPEQAQQMEILEIELLQRLGYANPYYSSELQ